MVRNALDKKRVIVQYTFVNVFVDDLAGPPLWPARLLK